MSLVTKAGLQRFFTGLKDIFAARNHTHNYAGSASAGGSANSAVKLDTATAGSATQPVYFSGGKPVATTYTLGKSVPSDAKFTDTNTWRGVQNNLTSDATDQSLSAAQGKALKALVDSKAASGHTHTTVNGITPEWSGSLGYNDTNWLAAWDKDGTRIKAFSKSNFAPASHEHGTRSIVNDNSTNFSGNSGPIEAAHIDVLRANRLAFLPANGVTVEYSTDGGATWVDYGATDAQKAGLFTMKLASGGAAFYTGKHTATADCTAKDQLRITVTPVDRYCSVNMLYMWVTVSGTTATVDIARSTIGAKTTFTNVRTDVPISGWSGPNEIRFSQGTFGGSEGQLYNAYSYRFTLKNTADQEGNVGIFDLRMYGPSAWGIPNNMVMNDHMYTWDNDKNVSFPAKVTATSFNGNASSATKLTNNAGTATRPVYFKDGVPVACNYDVNKTVPADAKFTDTDTWRGIQNNLTSDSTTDSLSAAQGKVLKALVDGKAASGHTHTKSQVGLGNVDNTADSAKSVKYANSAGAVAWGNVTGRPSSLPASDVYAWAKASTKPAYTKAEVGLGNVDNTADSAKSVKYATNAGSAGSAGSVVDYGTPNKTIQIGYGGSGISGDAIKFIAGYTTGDGETVDAKIKDISKDAMQNWLGLGGAAYTSASAYAAAGHTHKYASGFSVNGRTVTVSYGDGTSSTFTTQDTNTTYGAASQSANGLMSAADKKKLDGIASGANNFTYSLPTASATVLGGVKTGSNITNTSGVLSLTKANVTSALGYTPPTTNTTYGNATTSSSGLMSSSDKSKLNGIASGANKTVVDSTISQSSTNPVQNGVITKRLQFLYSFKISRDKWNESSDKSSWNVIVSWTNSSGTALTGSTTGTPNLTTNMSLGPAMMERTSSLKDNIILSGELSMINQGQIYVCDTNKLFFTVKRRPVCDLMLYFYARQWTT